MYPRLGAAIRKSIAVLQPLLTVDVRERNLDTTPPQAEYEAIMPYRPLSISIGAIENHTFNTLHLSEGPEWNPRAPSA